MKMIVAMVQPFRLGKVTSALEEIAGFPGMTVTDVRGFGREKNSPQEGSVHRVIEDFVEFVPKARIEIVALDDMASAIVTTIGRVARTGINGDGKIFVWSIETAMRIQTGESGDDAV